MPPVVECKDLSGGTAVRWVTFDRRRGELTFVNCFWPRRFLAAGPAAEYVCPAAELTDAREVGAGPLRRLSVSTREGRCLIAPGWSGYAALRDALAPHAAAAPRSLREDPRVTVALVLMVVLGVTGGLVAWLL